MHLSSVLSGHTIVGFLVCCVGTGLELALGRPPDEALCQLESALSN
jgi:hypothetical protein